MNKYLKINYTIMGFKYTFGKEKCNGFGEVVKLNIFSKIWFELFVDCTELLLNNKLIRKEHLSLKTKILKGLYSCIKWVVKNFVRAVVAAVAAALAAATLIAFDIDLVSIIRSIF